jgi:hypothetical protein
VAHHDDRVSYVIQRVQCGLRTLLIGRVGIIKREVWSEHPMSTRS